MNTLLTQALITTAIAVLACIVLMPNLIRWSVKLRLVDIPNERKLHKDPIPSIGGLVMMLSLLIAFALSAGMRQLFVQYWAVGVMLLVLAVTGVLDDRLNLPAKLRLLIQLAGGFLLAWQDIRLHSLHGIFGIGDIPVWLQYALNMLLVAGVTNAFNLLDGIDGLAGSIGFINVLVFAVVMYMLGQLQWLVLLLPFAGVLLVFLKYNWRPARLFMGDGGSLVLGFLVAVMGIISVENAYAQTIVAPDVILVLVSATMMLPVMDTLRVFYTRIQQGRSPFSADKNHLHHWFVRQHLVHSQATTRVSVFHLLLIGFSVIMVFAVAASWVVLWQIALLFLYSKFLQLNLLFKRWYRFIKRMESA